MNIMAHKTPFFSVIVPTHNRPEQLGSCLAAFCRLDYPRDRFDVIIVDDGSEKPLDTIIKAFHHQLNIILIRQKNAGPAAARNTGMKRAKGRFLVFTDDDCPPAPDWLRNLERRFTENPDCAIGGRIVNFLCQNPYSVTSQVISDTAYAYYNPDPNHARFVGAANVAVPADRFRSTGGFNTDFSTAEDREFCDRWLNSGYRIIHAPEVIVYHSHWLTFRSFCKQHFEYGRGAFKYQQIRAMRKTGKMRSDMKFHFHFPVLLCKTLSAISPKQPVTVIMLLILWEFVNTVGFFYEKTRSGK